MKTNESKFIEFIHTHPNYTWDEIVKKFIGHPDRTIFNQVQFIKKKSRTKGIVEKVRKCYNEKNNWNSWNEFYSYCIKKGISKTQKETIRRVWSKCNVVNKQMRNL